MDFITNNLQYSEVRILLLNPLIWWLIVAVSFLSQITVAYAHDFDPIVSDNPGYIYDERDFVTEYIHRQEKPFHRLSEFNDRSFLAYKTSKGILQEIIRSEEFPSYEKPVKDLVTKLLFSMNVEIDWRTNVNYNLVCDTFDMLLRKYNNDNQLRALYYEYLVIQAQKSYQYTEYNQYTEYTAEVWKTILNLYPIADDFIQEPNIYLQGYA
jgi:hypothetical protein